MFRFARWTLSITLWFGFATWIVIAAPTGPDTTPQTPTIVKAGATTDPIGWQRFLNDNWGWLLFGLGTIILVVVLVLLDRRRRKGEPMAGSGDVDERL
jgi:hypothetical protein